MDIGKYFFSSKKRNLSDSSKEDKDPKNAKEAHQATVTKTTMFLKVWTFQTREVFFLKSSKNLESKVNEIFANTNALKENQIKDEKQLAELTETVNFLSERFHEL